MQLFNRLLGDQVKAKYSNAKFYIKQILILIIKACGVFSISSIMFIVFFLILTPYPNKITKIPVFQVKKSNENSMITIYTNKNAKQALCYNESTIYFGKLYTKQQYCQFEHEQFPQQMNTHSEIDITIYGMNSNVQYITACIVKTHTQPSVCQKFAYNQNIKVFNNLIFQNLYSFQIEFNLRHPNQYFGDIHVIFEQQNLFIVKFIKDYYSFLTIFVSILMALILTFSFIIFQIPQIIEKSQHSSQLKKIKQA